MPRSTFHESPVETSISIQSLCDKDGPQDEGKFTTCCRVLGNLLATHATEEVNAEAEADIAKLKQPDGMFSVCYSKVPMEKILQGRLVLDESSVKGVCIDGLHEFIRFAKSTY